MSELPDDLRALLNLVKDAHDPSDPGARGRVRHAIASSLLMASGTGAASSVFPEAAASNTMTVAEGAKAAKAGWVLFGSKAVTLVAGTAAVVGLSLASYQYAPQTPPVQAARATTTAHGAATASALRSQANNPLADTANAPAARGESASTAGAPEGALRATPAAPVGDVTAAPASTTESGMSPHSGRRHKARPNADDLAAEMALVRAASDALARGDEAAALTVLHEHARRFANGSLRLEREGLGAIAECTRESGPSSASAKRFLRLYPHSLLSARVTKACSVE